MQPNRFGETKQSANTKENSMYLIELILGWLLAKRNGGEYFIMEDEL